MAKLLLNYTVLDEEYANGKFWFFQGEDGKPSDVELPKDTGLVGPIGPMDSDPVVHSYMGGADMGEARALVSVISNSQPQEMAKYSLCVPAIPAEPGAPVAWTAGGPQGVRFVSSDKPPVPIPRKSLWHRPGGKAPLFCGLRHDGHLYGRHRCL
ncbi:MAG: hypothetical protein LBK63_03300 [Treponema sp.]|jgi:hypothetical protein|nr:hypothetical protein [Treponema sp.]